MISKVIVFSSMFMISALAFATQSVQYPINCVGQDLEAKQPIVLKIFKKEDVVNVQNLVAVFDQVDYISIGNLVEPISILNNRIEQVAGWERINYVYYFRMNAPVVQNQRISFSMYKGDKYSSGNIYEGLDAQLSIDLNSGDGTFSGTAVTADGSGAQNISNYPVTCTLGVEQ